MDGDDGFTLPPKPLQNAEDETLGRGIDASHRFVHEIDIGPLRQSAGDEGPLLLATGQLADLSIGEFHKSHIR